MLRGRRFTYRGLRTIIRSVGDNFDSGRTRISEIVCRKLGWRQPNGWLKDRACRDVLRELEKLHIIKLPPRLSAKSISNTRGGAKEIQSAVDGMRAVGSMPQRVELELAKGNASEKLWNALVHKHHYLGHKVQVGRCLKYLVRGDGELLGAISFSSPAWTLTVRDQLLRKLGIGKAKLRDFVINNSRFLILPNVRVPHLASRILAEATRRVAIDWTWYYSITPLIAETFVEPNRFKGTCYRAANWIEIGRTSGYAKVGSSHHNSQQPKKLFVYGLTRRYRRKLQMLVSSLGTQESVQ